MKRLLFFLAVAFGPVGFARDQAAKAINLVELRAAAKGVLLDAQDGDKTLPPFQTIEAAVARRKLSDIPDHAATILFYETQSGSGGRGVVFLDGRTERVSAARWEALRAAGKLP